MHDILFDDFYAFEQYFKRHNSRDLRDRLLVTDKLRLWYCYGIDDAHAVWSGITSNPHIVLYCRLIQDRKELWSKPTGIECIADYTSNVARRPELMGVLGK